MSTQRIKWDGTCGPVFRTSVYIILTLMALLVITAGTALGQTVGVTNTFSADTPAVADEVNQNFSDLAGHIQTNRDNLSTHQGDTSAHADTLGVLTSCATGQVVKWNGSAWACGDDTDTNTDTLATLSCATDQIAKWNGSAWNCANDANTVYSDVQAVSAVAAADSYQGRYKSTVVVSPVTGDALASGTALAAAYSSGTAAEPKLVVVEPGVYDLGSGSLSPHSYTHLKGAGMGKTVIKSSIIVLSGAGGATQAEFSGLTMESSSTIANGYVVNTFQGQQKFTDVEIVGNFQSTTRGYGFFANEPYSLEMRNVKVSVNNASGESIGIYSNYGTLHDSTITLKDVDISVTAASPNQTFGYYSTGGTSGQGVGYLDFTDVSISVSLTTSVGIYAHTDTELNLRNSRIMIDGPGYNIYNSSTGTNTNLRIYNSVLDAVGTGSQNSVVIDQSSALSSISVSNSQLTKPATNVGLATLACFNNHDAAFAAAPCP